VICLTGAHIEGTRALQAKGKSVEAGHLYTPTLFCPCGLPFWPERAPSAPSELLTLRYRPIGYEVEGCCLPQLSKLSPLTSIGEDLSIVDLPIELVSQRVEFEGEGAGSTYYGHIMNETHSSYGPLGS